MREELLRAIRDLDPSENLTLQLLNECGVKDLDDVSYAEMIDFYKRKINKEED